MQCIDVDPDHSLGENNIAVSKEPLVRIKLSIPRHALARVVVCKEQLLLRDSGEISLGACLGDEVGFVVKCRTFGVYDEK